MLRPLSARSLGFSIALACGAAALGCGASSDDSAPPAAAPSDDAGDDGTPKTTRPAWQPVQPAFIGSGGFGFSFGSSFPGAAAPHGLAKVGPDTSGPNGTVNFLHFSGYWYGDDTVEGFSHMHLHGTGATDYGVLAVMPLDAPVDASRTTRTGYASKFQKASESSEGGKYALKLDRGDIDVAIAATVHAAHHRYAYPAGTTSGHVLFDLDHHLESNSIESAEVTLAPEQRRASGHLRTKGGMSGGYDLYFAAYTKQPWKAQQVWSAGSAPADGASASGTGVGFAIDCDLADGEPVEVRVGLSLVSVDAAEANLAAEIPGFDFDATAAKTAAEWDAIASKVRVQGGTDDDRTVLAGALYHAFLMPTVTSDVDGGHRGIDGQIKPPSGFRYVTDMSLWDTYRTLHELYSLVAPDDAREAAQSLLEMGQTAGQLPQWPMVASDSGSMIGASAEVVFADAELKGVGGFDAEAAYALLRAAAMDATAPAGGRGGRDQVEAYMQHGYVPSTSSGSVSLTIEYAQDDFALGLLAGALGKSDDAAALAQRSQSWRNLFDPESKFLWAKKPDGSWATPHGSPTAQTDEFVEANAWQSVFGALWDVDGLVSVFGGRDALVAALTTVFEHSKADYETIDWATPLRYGAPRPYFWAANEPDIHYPYLFALAGRPDLTQQWVAWARSAWYGPGADGLPGNDDGGTMSAWWIWSALGVYPIAGSDRYVVGTPLFTHAELAVAGGTFTIDAPGASKDAIYVQSVKLNGAPIDAPVIRHADLHAGGSLVFEMGTSPGAWGRE